MRFVKPLLAPDVRSLNDVPMGLLQVAILGALGGPLVGLFCGWIFWPIVPKPAEWAPLTLGQWLRFGALGGITYALVFYSVFGLAIANIRVRYPLSRASLLLLQLTGWIIALTLLTLMSPSGEWFTEAIRGRSVRIIAVATILFLLIAIFRTALDRARAQKAAAEAQAQVKALQAQINPHFFFNTLNTIYALIPVNPEAAQRTVALLADMSRHAFATAQSELVPLADELNFANAYLELEKIRFGSRLQCEMPEPAKTEGIQVPALSVQPLIENAVRHGIARRLDGGRITVELDRTDAFFTLTVQNHCEPSPERSTLAFFRGGHALENIRDRLRLHYGNRASIAVTFPKPDAVAVSLTGPVR